jgi:hypothetical protein
MGMEEENVPVSSTDELIDDGAEKADRTRKFGEYRVSNVPLPAVEMEERAVCGWIPQRASRLHDVIPIEERDPMKTDYRRETVRLAAEICRTK